VVVVVVVVTDYVLFIVVMVQEIHTKTTFNVLKLEGRTW